MRTRLLVKVPARAQVRKLAKLELPRSSVERDTESTKTRPLVRVPARAPARILVKRSQSLASEKI